VFHAIPHLDAFDRRLPAIRTTRPDFARSHLGRIFANHGLVLKSSVVDFVHQHTRLCDTSIGLLRYGSDVEVIAPALDFYLLQMTLSGEIGVRSSQFDVTLGSGSVFVTNPGVAYRKYWSRDARQLMIKIPRTRLESRAAEVGSKESGASIVFANRAHSFDGAVRPLLRLVDYLCRDLWNDNWPLRNLGVRRDLEDALLGALLATVPHERRSHAIQRTSGAIPHYLTRAENHLSDNAFRVVPMSEMTVVTGVSERTLQDGFLRFCGKPPGQFARELRLDLVRRALIAKNDDDNNVTKIALQFGFAHLGRFSRSYADRFGEYPSDTLRRKRTH
jgi:AraC-like DNA-binding protein